MAEKKNLRDKRPKCNFYSLKRQCKMVKRMEYDVKNGDQTTLDSFK